MLVIRADLRYNKESTPSMKCIEMGENKFMQKKALLALLLVLTMILSGCSLIVKDEAVDAARVDHPAWVVTPIPRHRYWHRFRIRSTI